MRTDDEAKGRRITIDLTSAAAQEVDRLRQVTGLTPADMFRSAFCRFRLYIQAREQGNELCIVDQRQRVKSTACFISGGQEIRTPNRFRGT